VHIHLDNCAGVLTSAKATNGALPLGNVCLWGLCQTLFQQQQCLPLQQCLPATWHERGRKHIIWIKAQGLLIRVLSQGQPHIQGDWEELHVHPIKAPSSECVLEVPASIPPCDRLLICSSAEHRARPRTPHRPPNAKPCSLSKPTDGRCVARRRCDAPSVPQGPTLQRAPTGVHGLPAYQARPEGDGKRNWGDQTAAVAVG
jgi:hypothetical protein